MKNGITSTVYDLYFHNFQNDDIFQSSGLRDVVDNIETQMTDLINNLCQGGK